MSADERDDDEAAKALPWLAPLPWHEAPMREALAHRDTWPHALLIHGPRGIGKHALALGLAQALLCEAPRADGLACGECPGCRYAMAGEHPDLMRLELIEVDPKDGELKAVDAITIPRVRALIDFVTLTGHRQRAKVAVIAPAERMNPQAANALLKTLEEPPPGTFLILAADLPGPAAGDDRQPLPQDGHAAARAEAAVAWLHAQHVAEAELTLAQAAGAPRIALALADAAVQAERRAWLTALAQPERLSVVALASGIDAGARDERRARLARLIDWLLAWTGDLARVAAGGTPRRNPDFAAILAKLATRLAPLAAFRYHGSLLRQRALLGHPLTPRLVAEAMLIDYRALFR